MQNKIACDPYIKDKKQGFKALILLSIYGENLLEQRVPFI